MAFEIVEFEINRIPIHYSEVFRARADELVIQAKELNYRITLFRANCPIYHCSSMVLC
jgi:hypothetical protein